jgi:MFS family permease
LLAALRFNSPDRSQLAQLTGSEWKQALAFADRSQLTLPLALTCRECLPDWVRQRVDRDLENNAERWRRIQSAYAEAGTAFRAQGLEFLVLKGFTHCPDFVADPRHRPQFDIDLFFPKNSLLPARDVALDLGYQPIVPFDRHPIDHLPTLIRKTGWEWRGDFYDPDIPLSLELHFRFWDEQTERFAPQGLDEFWDRREGRELDGLRFTALHPADAIAYSALHSLRHLLRGGPRLYHFYELAWLLHHRAGDLIFWNAWSELHDDSLRRLEAICFSIAHRWFGCRLPAAASDEIDHLPSQVKRWLDEYSWSPVAGMFRPNKDELWLHWSLIDSRRDRLAVLRRRLLPERLPGPVDSVHIPDGQMTWRLRLRSHWRFLKFVASRALHHTRAFPPTVWSALRWFGGDLGLGADYWRFLLAEGFFDFGMFVFFFLYNLYLLQLGFDEKFLGLMSGIMTAGNVAGSILAVFAMRRFGIQRTLMTSFALTAGLSAVRSLVISAPALVFLAAGAGLVSSVWPVALAPAVASVTTEKSRSRGFSFICSSGIAIGIFGSLAAGRMPGWISRAHWTTTSVASYRASLLVGCSIVSLALWPLWRMKMSAAPPVQERSFHRPSPLVLRFLIAMLIWNLGTGIFNPFRNVFFARRIHLAVEQIGYVFSWSQVAQVGAVLLAPLTFRKFGVTRGIAGMEFATAVTLLALAAVTGPLSAAIAYCAFMSAQYMSEPGMFTLLMDRVPIGERNSASALNFLVSFAGQAIAAAVAGVALARFGYPPVLTSAAVICALAGFLFRVLLGKPKPDSPSPL